jgi:invasion protein IalB
MCKWVLANGLSLKIDKKKKEAGNVCTKVTSGCLRRVTVAVEKQ